MGTSISVSFDVAGFECAPEELTRRIGIVPGYTRVAGMPLPHAGHLHYKTSRWGIKSQVPSEEPLDAHVDSVMERLTPVSERLREVCRGLHVSLICGMIIDGGDRPAVGFEASVIRELAKWGALIDVDLYT
ncbi:MAG: DUF4279 domain-containing protein [Phycisphaerae bacterium]|jgi:hypothetical protein